MIRSRLAVLALAFVLALIATGSAHAQGAPTYGGSITYNKPVDDAAPAPSPNFRPAFATVMSGDSFELRQWFVGRVAQSMVRPNAQLALKSRALAKRAAIRLP
ncbi:MAG: hypothetical protein ABL977_12520 [Candidatus Eisenbacteria bacterium]